jgi:hypothetical protein
MVDNALFRKLSTTPFPASRHARGDCCPFNESSIRDLLTG